jgi:hypothetical protein
MGAPADPAGRPTNFNQTLPGRWKMNSSDKSFDGSCYSDCESMYEKCMSSREHESVCKMKMAQCSCGCIIE